MKTITTSEERNYMSNGVLHHLVDEKEISHVRLFSHITLNPGEEVKFHEHHGEYEIYYILSGKGIYSDNGKESEVTTGCVTFCKSGDAHSIRNASSTALEFIALVVVE